MNSKVPRKVLTLHTHRFTGRVMQALLANVVVANRAHGITYGSPASGRAELDSYAGHATSFPHLAEYFTSLLEHTTEPWLIRNISAVEYAIYHSHISIQLECTLGEEGDQYTSYYILNFPTKNFSHEDITAT